MEKVEDRASPGFRTRLLVAAKQSGNVSATCSKFGIDRTTFYRLAKRAQGLSGDDLKKALRNRPRRWKSHGQQTTPEEVKKITRLALAHPGKGCDALSVLLLEQGCERSGKTIQKILNAKQLGTRHHRWLAIDRKGVDPTNEQIALLAEFNPNWRDRRLWKQDAGARLFCGVVPLSPLPGLPKLWLYVAVDGASAYSFAALRLKLSDQTAAKWFDESVLNQATRLGVRVREVAMCKDSEAYGTALERVFKGRGISLKERPQMHSLAGFVDRFRRVVEHDFVLGGPCDDPFDDEMAAKKAFRSWVREYNDRSSEGFPAYSKPPRELFAKPRGKPGRAANTRSAHEK